MHHDESSKISYETIQHMTEMFANFAKYGFVIFIKWNQKMETKRGYFVCKCLNVYVFSVFLDGQLLMGAQPKDFNRFAGIKFIFLT